MTLEDAIADYLAAVRQAGRSPATVRQYRFHLGRLAAALAADGLQDLAQLSKPALRQWGAGIADAYAPATAKTAVTAARSWLQWCHEEGYLPAELAPALKYPKVPIRLQRTLSRSEIQALLAACDPRTANGLRDAALISLLVDSGIRRQEMINLAVDALDLQHGRARVTRKGGNEEFAWFGPAAAMRLAQWLAVRWAFARGNEDAVFVAIGGSYPGRKLTPEGLRTIVRKLGDRAGVAGVTPHAFRRSFATLRLEGGDSTRTVQALGGWNRIDMVERYSRALDVGRLAAQHAPMNTLDSVYEQETLLRKSPPPPAARAGHYPVSRMPATRQNPVIAAPSPARPQ